MGRAVRAYLEALEEQNKPKKRGRRRTPDAIRMRLAEIAATFDASDPMTRLQMASEQIALEDELAELEQPSAPVNMEELEAEFIKVAAQYGAAKNVVYGAWRAVGVPPKVLRAAGIRGRAPRMKLPF